MEMVRIMSNNGRNNDPKGMVAGIVENRTMGTKEESGVTVPDVVESCNRVRRAKDSKIRYQFVEKSHSLI